MASRRKPNFTFVQWKILYTKNCRTLGIYEEQEIDVQVWVRFYLYLYDTVSTYAQLRAFRQPSLQHVVTKLCLE